MNTDRIADRIASGFFCDDIESLTEDNSDFLREIWTGDFLQMTLMSIPVGGDIGLEVHDGHDQFIRIEDGEGMVYYGQSEDNLESMAVKSDDAVIIPAGMWHNLVNTSEDEDLKIYSLYSPPEHEVGKVVGDSP